MKKAILYIALGIAIAVGGNLLYRDFLRRSLASHVASPQPVAAPVAQSIAPPEEPAPSRSVPVTHEPEPPGIVLNPILAPKFLFLPEAPAGAAGPSATPAVKLSPAAADFMKRGLIAARQRNWDQAIRYFTDALQEHPEYPEGLFNLALAFDQAGGREITATCYFHAFLAAAPQAANAGQVRDRIIELDVAVERNMQKLANTARKAAEELPEDSDRRTRLVEVAGSFALANDDAGATRIAESLGYTQSGKWNYDSKWDAYAAIAGAQANRGDLAAAASTARGISGDLQASHALSTVASKLTAAGEKAKALELLNEAESRAAGIGGEGSRGNCYRHAAEERAGAGDLAGAFRLAEKTTGDETERQGALEGIAKAQFAAGDLEGAAQTAAKLPGDSYGRASLCSGIIAARLKDEKPSGEAIAAARSLAEGLRPHERTAYPRNESWERVAEALLKRGDLEAAFAATSNLDDESVSKAVLLAKIAMAYSKAGKAEKAREMIPRIAIDDYRANALTALATDDLAAGRREEGLRALDAALKAADSLKDGDYHKTSALQDIAKALITAGEFDRATGIIVALGKDASYVQSNLLDALVKAGDVEAITRFAGRVEDPAAKDQAYAALASILARRGDFAPALAAIPEISAADQRGDTQCAIVESVAAAGDPAGAAKIGSEIEHAPSRAKAFLTLARNAGPSASRAALAEQARVAAVAITDPAARATLLLEIGRAAHDFGDDVSARALLAEVAAAIPLVEDEGTRCGAAMEAAVLFGRMNSPAEAVAALSPALKTVAAAQNPRFRARQGSELAWLLAQLGDRPATVSAATDSIKAAASVAKPEERREEFLDIAGDIAGLGIDREPAASLHAALSAARLQQDPASDLATTVPLIAAREYVGSAVAVIGEIGTSRNRIAPLAVLAKSLLPDIESSSAKIDSLLGGDDPAALRLALALASAVGPHSEVIELYLKIARSQEAAADPKGALASVALARDAAVASDYLHYLVYIGEIQSRIGEVSAALATARTTKDPLQLVEALHAVARPLVEKKDFAAAIPILEEARACALEKLTGDDLFRWLQAIAGAQLDASDPAAAKTSLASLDPLTTGSDNPSYRHAVLGALLARSGDLDGARARFQHLTRDSDREILSSAVVSALIAQGQLAEAGTEAEQVSSPYYGPALLVPLARAHSAAGDAEAAKAFLDKAAVEADGIPGEGLQWNRLCEIAEARAELGDQAGAAAMLREAGVFDKPASLFSLNDSNQAYDTKHSFFYGHDGGDSYYERLVSARIAAGDLPGALEAALRASSPPPRARNLRRVIRALLDRGMTSLALETAGSIPLPYSAWLAVRDIEGALREKGESEKAHEIAQALAATGFETAIEEAVKTLVAGMAQLRAKEVEAAKAEGKTVPAPYRASDEIKAWIAIADLMKSLAASGSADYKAPFNLPLFVEAVQKLGAVDMIRELVGGVRYIHDRRREIDGVRKEWEKRRAGLTEPGSGSDTSLEP